MDNHISVTALDLSLSYRSLNVSMALKPMVEAIWECEIGGNSKEWTPAKRCYSAGYLEFIVHVKGSPCKKIQNGYWESYPQVSLVGLSKEANIWKAEGNSKLLGLRFTPEGIYELTGIAPKEVNHLAVEAALIKCDHLFILAEILSLDISLEFKQFKVEAYLYRQLNKSIKIHQSLKSSLGFIRNNVHLPVADIAKSLQINERSLQRSLEKDLGFSPKAYSRLIRLYKSHFMGASGNHSILSLSFNLGYADSAHFSKEFKSFFGESPAVYFKELKSESHILQDW